jgi:hypothetical protein
MERRSCFDEVARKILVVRVLLDELIRIDRGQYFVSRNVPLIEPHVHVVSPVQSAPADAVLNESNRIFGMSMSFRSQTPSGSLPRTNRRGASATIPLSRRSNRRIHIMRFDLQDVALRTLILVAGGLAAVLLALKGQGQALPALAVGGTLGAFVMARFGPRES